MKINELMTASAKALAVCLVFLLAFWLNGQLPSAVMVNDHASWIFLPSAVRVLSVLVLGRSAVAGLFAGSLIVNLFISQETLIAAIILAGITAIAPALGVWVTLRFHGLPPDLSGLRAHHLMWLSVVFSLISVAMFELYFFIDPSHQVSLLHMLPIFTGDVLGTLIVLTLASVTARLLRVSS